MTAIAPKLSEWTTMWAAALPGFAVDSTWRVGRTRWSPLDTRPFERAPDSAGDVTFQILGLRSPDGQRILDVDGYQSIEPVGDILDVGGEPDSQSSLIDQKSGIEAILQQCGTGGGSHWGAWLSSKAFVLGGWRDADDFGQWKQGRLYVYSIPDSTVGEYQTRIVSASDFARYEAAWHGWLLKRYRALKTSRPRT